MAGPWPTTRELIEFQAESHGTAIAALAPNRVPLSFDGLAGHIHATVERLRALGLGQGDRVASVLPNGSDAATAVLAVSSATTIVPLNPDATKAEYDALFLDLSPRALLIPVGSAHPAWQAARALRIPVLEVQPQPEAGRFTIEGRTGYAAYPCEPPASEDFAYIIATSGTESRPKFVPVSHRIAFHGAVAIVRSVGLGPEDRCLSFNPLFHSLGLLSGLLGPLSAGGSVACLPGFQAAHFANHLRDLQPTWFSAVPAVLQVIAEHAVEYREAVRDSRIRVIRSAGAALPASVVEPLRQLFGVPLLEVYGMSEAPCIAGDVFHGPERKPGSVGRPLQTRDSIRVVDEVGTNLPSGRAGEVVVRGPWVISGYFRNEAATASAFQDGWFYTGDVGYFDGDGFLFLTGRGKEFINRGGEKISPVEVDEVLLSHPSVAEAITFAIPDAALGEEIAAAIVLRPNSPLSAAALQEFAATHIAAHKVPRRIVFVSQLPKGPSGKLNRFRVAQELGLDTAATESPRPEAEFVAPRDEREKVLAWIFRRVLGVERIGIHDNFFDRGGDSLGAVRCVAEIQAAFGLTHLSAALFLWAPTVAGVAEVLSDPLRLGGSSDILPIQPHGRGLPFFLVGPGLWSRELARCVGAEHPFFGVPVPSLERQPPPHTVERLAAECVRAVRRFRPEGPYALGGWCASGLLALEIARQLEEEGEQVAFVAMLDARGILLPPMPAVRRLWVRGVRAAGRAAFLSTRTPAELWLRMRAHFARLGRPAGRDDMIVRALPRYRPHPWTGRVLHLWAADRARGPFRDPEFEWSHLSPRGFQFHEVPGDHLSMLREPNVARIAQILSHALESAPVNVRW
jgi:acyl-CoA synthetase (AMP-forming)/AMP-acid ligase II/thioesterase domain-containing protein